MKLKTLLILTFLLITALVIIYIDHGIKNYGVRFHTGKDGGYFMRFEFIVYLNTIWYILQIFRSKKKFSGYFLAGITGFFIGIVVGIACYMIIPGDNGLIYHLTATVVCYVSFFGIHKLKRMSEKHQNI